MTQDSTNFFRRYDFSACRRERDCVKPAQHRHAALDKLDRWFAANDKPAGALLVLPTGAGKTFTATHFLCR